MYRIVLGLLCAVVVVSFAAHGANGQLLTNGDLEDPAVNESDVATGWTLLEPDGNSATFATFANHTPGGERGLWLRPFAGSGDGGDPPATVDAILYQDVPGTPGTMYELSAWFLYELAYSGLDAAVGTQTLLTLEFLDAGDGVIGSSVLDIDTVQMNDAMWRQYSVNGVAPAGTATVRAGASMLDGEIADANPQSAFVDDFALTPTPGAAVVFALGGLAGLRRRRL